MRNGPPVAGTLGGAESSLDQKQSGARGSIATRQGGAKPRRAKRDRLDARVDALLAVQPVSHHGVVVDNVNVNVREYDPVRSASVAPTCCVNVIATGPLDTGALQLDGAIPT